MRAILAAILLLPSVAFAQPAVFKTTGAAPAPITPSRPGGDYLRMPSGDLRVRSSGAAFDLKFGSDEVLSADRLFKLNVGNAARTLTLSGNPTLGDWFDQPVKAASSPTFVNVTAALTGNATTATTLATSRNLWGQAFTGAADVTGSLTGVDDITGGESSMVILAGTGVSRSMTLRTSDNNGDPQTILTLTPDIAVTAAFTGGVSSSGFVGNLTGNVTGNVSGAAASLSISGQTGLMTVTGLASTNRIKTVRDAADTILELGGSYTPTGTWTSVGLASPTITTPTFSGAAVWPDDVRQTFNPGAGAAGLNVGAQTTDPGTPLNGDLYYDSDDNLLRARINSAWVSLGASGGVPTTITVSDSTDATSFPAMFDSATGDLAPRTDGGLTYNASTGILTATGLSGPHNGTVGATTPAAGTFTTGVFSTTTTANVLAVTRVAVDPAASSAAIQVTSTNNTFTGASSNSFFGVGVDLRADQSGGNVTAAYSTRGLSLAAYASGSANTVTGVAAQLCTGGNLGAGTLTNFYGLAFASIVNSGGGTLANNTLIDIPAQTAGSTSINGIKCAIASGTGRLGLNFTGTVANYLEGSTGIGTSTTSAAKLTVLSTTSPQLVLQQTASIYGSMGVAATTGVVTFDSVGGSTPAFVLSDATTISERLTMSKFYLWDGGRYVSTQFDKTSDTTLAKITGLGCTVEAGKKYIIEAYIPVNMSIMGGGKFSLSGAATWTTIEYNMKSETYASTPVFTFNARNTAKDSVQTLPGASTQLQRVTFTGGGTCNAGGEVEIHFAQATSNGTPSSVLVGGWLRVTEVQ